MRARTRSATVSLGRIAAWALAIQLLLTMSAATATASAPALPQTTTIAGAQTGYVDVELTKTLRPLDEDAPAVTREGGGLFTAAVLRPAGASGGAGEASFEVFWIPGFGEIRSYRGNSERTLPAGDYRLYLAIVDPGSVTLDFGSLPAGNLVTAPAVHTPFVAHELETRRSASAVRFGETHTVSGGGRVFLRAVASNPPLGSQIELCSYRGGAEAQTGDAAYGPGCPGGNSGYKAFLTGSGQGAFSLADAGWSTKQIGSGGNVSVPFGSPGSVDAFGVWMSYDFPETTPPGSVGSREREPFPNPPPTSWCESSCPPPSSSQNPRHGTATLTSRQLLLKGRQVSLPLACSADGSCSGTAAIARSKERFALPAATQSTVSVRAPGNVIRRMRRQGHARVSVAITSELESETRQQRVRLPLSHRKSGRRSGR